MNIQQEPEHTPPMQWWKKILILFLMIACIASAAYHHKDIDTSAVAANSVSQKTPQVQPAPQEPTEEPEKSSTPAVTDFSDVALLGNSYIDGFHIYNSLPGRLPVSCGTECQDRIRKAYAWRADTCDR